MIPEDVRRFVLTSIPSVPFLEALLIFRAKPGECIGVSDIARALYMPPKSASDLLKSMCLAGLLSVEDSCADAYHYAPVDVHLSKLIDELALAYSHDLIGVTNLIHGATRKTATRFADAFKIRKD